jgi:hypothetical protein
VYDSADFTSESAEDARIVRLYEAFGVNTITPEAPGCSDFSPLKMIESNATMLDVFRSIDKVTNVTVVAATMLRPNSSCDYDLRRVTIWSVNSHFSRTRSWASGSRV